MPVTISLLTFRTDRLTLDSVPKALQLSKNRLNFKTNSKWGGCTAVVTLYLNDIEQLDGWNVDTAGPDKILTVLATDNRIGEVVEKAIEQAGYKAEPMPRP